MALELGYLAGDAAADVPRLIVTEGAVTGLERCRQFLAIRGVRDPDGAYAAKLVIEDAFDRLQQGTAITRPDIDPACRILVIPFRKAGYLVQVRPDLANDVIYVTAFRHQLEQSF